MALSVKEVGEVMEAEVVVTAAVHLWEGGAVDGVVELLLKFSRELPYIT